MFIQRALDPQSFAASCEYFLLQNEPVHCVAFGVLHSLVSQPDFYPEFFLWKIEDQRRLLGIAYHTPPFPLALSLMPEAAVAVLADYLDAEAHPIDQVSGPKTVVDAFVDLWCHKTGQKIRSLITQGIYRADTIKLAYTVPGHMRLTEPKDEDLLMEWLPCFFEDCRLPANQGQIEKITKTAIEQQTFGFWMDQGREVAMAAALGPTPHGIRISYVYTPPEYRGRGYGSAVTAAVSQQQLDRGRNFCFLYTDLQNPTSNRIYQKMGYQPVMDAAHYFLEPG
ncbi:MAG: GNAT family N-acetyltransferase [Proteobacteria bacterium]|nr:GNAT family N-acetyltransferase [Pseudomonadota bacterium]